MRLSVTAGHYRSYPSGERMIPPMRYGMGTFVHLAHTVEQSIEVPVIGVGRLGDPLLAEQAVRSGQMDLVALGRPLLADPSWARKVRDRRAIRPCLACNHCVDTMRAGGRISCVVNPTTGREREFAAEAGPTGGLIYVIGAGPAGLSLTHHSSPSKTRSSCSSARLVLEAHSGTPPWRRGLTTSRPQERRCWGTSTS